jgi:hypothetical protein
VGVALQMFVDEHNDQLPPGGTNSLFLTELPVYSMAGEFNRHLSYHLAGYLSLPSPEQIGVAKTNLARVMLCPGYTGSLPGNTEARYNPESDGYTHAYCFAVSRYVLTPDAGFPFGWQATGQPSLKLSEIAAVKPLSDAWAISDMDWDAAGDPTSLGTDRTPYVAMHPVHGAVRNLLYFDQHVAAVKNDDWESF